MAPRPAFLAGLLRKQLGIEGTLPVDVDQIVKELEIDFAEAELDGLLGLFIPAPIGPGILLRAGQEDGQRRFTIAHELGHFALPKHADQAVSGCLTSDPFTAAINSRVEDEANQFAVELLMPRSAVGLLVDDRDPSFALVKTMAKRFRVSHTAAAIRLVETTSEPCAVVCGERGTVRWWRKSRNCDVFLECERHSAIPANSCMAAVFRGEGTNDVPADVQLGTWFRNWGRKREMESTFHIPSLQQVLSLVWFVTDDPDDEY